nr:sugar phosphate isomerase/epimerase [Anaerosolibacter carboniphilus]
MIGQYGKFDYSKFARDFKENFYGIEACLFENENDVEYLVAEAEKGDFNIGIHFPLRFGISRLRDPQFLSLDEEIRSNTFNIMENEFIYIKEKQVNPKYILFHFPKPVILDETVSWNNWRFADPSEYVFESQYRLEEFKKNSSFLFQWLSEKGRQYNFMPVLELDALNQYVYETQFIEEQLGLFPNIRICLDLGRLHLQDEIDTKFSAMDIIKKFANFTEIVHLWNVRVNENIDNRHYPALPRLKPEDGWAPIEKYIRQIKLQNKHVKIMFEHRSDLISDKDLDECYSWINDLLK